MAASTILKIFFSTHTFLCCLNFQRLAEKYPEILKPYQNETNLGISGNFNGALQHVSGDWLVFGGGDDPFDPNLLKAQWDAVKDEPDEVFAFSNVDLVGRTGQFISSYHDVRKGPVPEGYIFVEVASRQLYNQAKSLFRNALIKTSIAKKHGLCDESLESYQDWDFTNLAV